MLVRALIVAGTTALASPDRNGPRSALSGEAAVSPHATSASVPAGSRQSQRFWIRNTTGLARYYDLDIRCPAPVSACTLSSWSTGLLGSGDSVFTDLWYTAPAAGLAGTAKVLAKLNGTQIVADSGTVSVQGGVGPSPATVTPHALAADVPANSQRMQRFWVRNSGTAAAYFDLDIRCQAHVTQCSLTRWSTGLLGVNDSVSTELSFTSPPLGATGVAMMVAKLNGTQTVADSGRVSVRAVDASLRLAPEIAPALHSPDGRDVALCVADCFEGVISYTTPAYVSMDVPHAVTLVYRSGLAKPLVTLFVDATDRSAEPPNQMSIQVRTPAGAVLAQTNQQLESWYQAGGGTQRLAAQFDPWGTGSGAPTGAYDYVIVVRSRWTDGTIREAAPRAMRALIVDLGRSPYGAGWWIAGLQQLYQQADGSALVIEGEGSVRLFGRACAPQPCYSPPRGDFSALTFDAGRGEWRRRYPDGTVVRFNSAGQMSAVADRFGNTSTYEYLPTGGLAQITDPAGKRFVLAYDGANKLRAVQDAGGRTTSVAVDAAGDLTSIVDPLGRKALSASYTPEHRLARWADASGGARDLSYDFAGRLERTIAPSVIADGASIRPTVTTRSTETALLYGPSQGSLTLPRPRTTIDSLDPRARVTGPRGFTTSFAVSGSGAPLLVVDSRGRRTSIAYDEHGRAVRTQTAAGRIVRRSYKGPDLAELWDSTSNRHVYLEYEPIYHEVSRMYGDLAPVWKYWSAGRLDSMRTGTASDTVRRFHHDARGRVDTIIDATGRRTSITYQPDGWRNTSVVHVAGVLPTTYSYDAYGRRVTVAAGGVTLSSTEYDALDLPRLVVGGLNDTTRFGYGPLGIDTVTDARAQRYILRRNALGWVETQTDPAGRSALYRYDANGNVTEVVNRRGQSVRFTYDERDLPSSRAADGEVTTYAFDGFGRFVATANRESVDTAKLDLLGRKTRELAVRQGVVFELSTGYDVRGRREVLSAVRPWSSTVRYRYDEASRLGDLTDLAGFTSTMLYDGDHFELQRTLPNGVTIGTGGYSGGHIPLQLTFPGRADLESALGARYAPDVRNHLADRMKTDSTGMEYAHDEAGQLLSATPYVYQHVTYECPREDDPDCAPEVVVQKKYGVATSFRYDVLGNPAGAGVVVEAGNRLRQLGDYRVDYDADGNVVRRYRVSAAGVVTWDQALAWNSLGQLTSVTTNGSTVSFGYDGWGRRVRKTAGGRSARFLWDGDDLFAEVDDAGNRVAEYTYWPGIDHPHSLRRGGGGPLFYYVTERPGHVIALLDAKGALAHQFAYSPFGELTASSGSAPSALRFGAREYDAESGLYYNRARYYDPALRRFLSEDPIGLDGGLNLYAYAGNAPLDARDPSGLCRVDELIFTVSGDGTISAKCPQGGPFMLPPVVSTGEQDPFAGINAYTKDLAERTDRFKQEAERAVQAAREETMRQVHDARNQLFLYSALAGHTAIRGFEQLRELPRTCAAAIQQKIAKNMAATVAVAVGGIVIRNFLEGEALLAGVATGGLAATVIGVVTAAAVVEEVCYR